MKKLSALKKKLIAQIDIETNEIINIFPSLSQAGKYIRNLKDPTIIAKVCKKYVSPLTSKKYETAYGYKWEFIEGIEGSTTISDESTLK